MRHWNTLAIIVKPPSIESFYPTYEALKPFFAITENGVPTGVFTLPMRHWNAIWLNHTYNSLPKFLPYLWGIETKSVKQFAWPHNRFLPYLWGIETIKAPVLLETINSVFTLPMRHWNQEEYTYEHANSHSFYPTYEALKRNIQQSIVKLPLCFYPTYEALKPNLNR